jgi:hypothetical protein
MSQPVTTAHVTLHFGLGMLLGMLCFAGAVLRALWTGRPMTRPMGRWILASYALGLYAALPNILLSLGAPGALCTGWWMNIFLFHPLLDRAKHGGMLTGEVILAACLGAQYMLLLLAIARAHLRRRRQPARAIAEPVAL